MAINAKVIAKNTGLLYFRMLLLMVVSLYTSRVLLFTLGIIDYGIYNVVGGIVVMIGFLQGTMGTASSRFVTVALSHGVVDEMVKVFSNIFLINLFLAVLVFFISETVGLWFFYNKMTIPEERITAAFWVYQFSVITIMINITTVTFNATIIAHEKMNAFAGISLFDAFAKLAIVYCISTSTFDRLIIYAFLMMLVTLIDAGIYSMYCRKKFDEAKTRLCFDKRLTKEMLGFISWASYGSFVSVGFTQGLNIILNLFFGPIVNAARGVAVQVQNAVVNFISNFQMAINPQLIKTTSQGFFSETQKLLVASSKYSFFLIYLLALPLLAETPFILSLWLKEVPDYSVSFCRIMLIISIWSSLANPLRIVNQAEGNIKKFQICECTLLLLIMPLSWFALKIWQIPIVVFIVHLSLELLAQIIRIYIVLPKIKMKYMQYYNQVLLKIFSIFFPSIMVMYVVNYAIKNNPTFISPWIFSISFILVMELFTILLIYLIGLSRKEREYVKSKVRLFKIHF